MANEGHILIPLSEHIRQQGFWDEYDRTQQVVKRPLHRDREMRGRVWRIKNEAIWDGKQYKSMTPLQVACAALDRARASSMDVIRVVTPVDLTKPGAKVAGSVDFSVDWLSRTMQDHTGFFPDVIGGKITMEEEAVNEMPNKWQFTPDGSVLAPIT